MDWKRNDFAFHSRYALRHLRIDERVRLPESTKIASTSCSSTQEVSQDLNKAGVVAVNSM